MGFGLSWFFSEGSFQTGSWTLEPPGFLFKAISTQLCCMSPSPPEPPRCNCSNWRCPKEGFLLVWDPQQLKHLHGGLRGRERSWPGALIGVCRPWMWSSVEVELCPCCQQGGISRGADHWAYAISAASLC